ncbi:MAG: glycogen-binding domain-containing protein [Desulfobacteraceae bacterium]|nr:glycogen-binding domain-containing protein [Desulfobacteraceae bacterium]
MSNSNKGKRRVVFRLSAPDAREVFIGGSFNGWDIQKHPLKRKPGGFWEKTVMLAPGRYEYKFRVDGIWRSDPANGKCCDDRFGGLNSVVEVVDAGPAALHTGRREKSSAEKILRSVV